MADPYNDDDPYAVFDPPVPAAAPDEDDPYAAFDAPPPPRPTPAESAAAATPFPMEPGEARAAQELPELIETGVRSMVPKEAGMFAGTPQAMAALTMTDPNEIASMMQATFPDTVGVQYAPDGTVILANNETGERVAINRPGISAMDVAQTLGLAAAFYPAGSIATMGAREIPKAAITASTRASIQRQARRRAVTQMAVASGVTEAGLQAGQELAGGQFDPEEVGLATALGAAPDILLDPLVRAGARGKEMLGRAAEVVPANIKQALQFAKEQGKDITTADALRGELTPAMNIFLKITERIPITGTGKQRVRQQAQRADTLGEIADEFDINVETEFGQDVAQSFVDRMIKQRFWGKNKNPTAEQVREAFQREGDAITDNLLNRYIRRGRIDEEVVDRVLDSGRTARIEQLFNRLDDQGKAAAQQRLVAKGLERAGWTPETPEIADPKEFMKYLDDPKTRKAVKAMFNDEQQNMLSGAREYLRLTSAAGDIGQGAGMTAAVAGGLGFAYGILDAIAGTAALMGGAGRIFQSGAVRNLMMKLHHAKGNPEAERAVMQELRPLVVAIGEQALVQDDIEDDRPFMIPLPKFLKKPGGGQMRRLQRSLGEVEEDITGRLEQLLETE